MLPLLRPLKTAAAVPAAISASSSSRTSWATTVDAGVSTGVPKVRETSGKRERPIKPFFFSTSTLSTLNCSQTHHPLTKTKGDTLASCGADRTVRTWHQLRSRSGGAGRTGGGGVEGEGRWAPDAVLEESQARAVRAVAWAPPPAAVAAAATSSKQRQQPQQRRGRRRRLAAASFDASVAVWEEERPAAAPPAGEGGEIENDDGGGENDDDDEPTLWSQVALLQGHESEVKGVAWSPLPGAIEAGSCSEEEEDENEEEKKKDEKSYSPSKPLPPLLADGEGCLLATCGRDRSVWLWESVPDSAAPSSSSSFNGSGIGAAGSAPCEFECVDVKQGHSGDVKAVAWHPSGSVLASASYDGSVRLWVPEGGAAEEGPGGGGGGGGVGGGNAAAAAAGDEWLCGQEVKGAHGGETVWSFAFEPRRGARRKKGRSEANAVRAASCGGDGRVSVWRCPLPFRGGAKGEPAATEALRWEAGAVARSAAPPPLGGRVRPAYSVDWSPCGRWIACGGGDDFVRVFRAPPREEDDEGEAGGGEKTSAAAVATSGGGETAVLELVAEARPSPPCEVNCVKWRRGRKKTDPPVLAAACDDGVVRLWRLVGEGGGE